jgi:putative nucleotidyltransferase with HDIG domain
MNQPIEKPRRDEDPVVALKTFVASVQHLPLFTGTAAQLVRSVDREDVTATELSRLIATDVALTAHLLRMVNSPYYGLSRKVGTVSEAFALLGLDLVRRTITVAVLQRPLFAYLHDSATARAFWRHKLVTAALSRHIAHRAGANAELAYMAGLMHDVGRLVLLGQFPEHVDMLLRRNGEDAGAAREVAAFGFTNAQVGAALLEHWGLPEEIVRAAHEHMDESQPDEPLSAAVWRANLLSAEMEQVEDDEEADEVQPWMQSIGLSVSARHKMLEEIEALEANVG